MSEFHVLIATSRDVVPAFVASLCDRDPAIRVTRIPLSTAAFDSESEALSAAAVAIVDASVNLCAALDVLKELRCRRRTLPIGVLFCCAYAADVQRLGEVMAAGAGGLFDFRLSAEEMLDALRCLAGGRGLFHLELPEGSTTRLSDAFDASPRHADDVCHDDWALLNLVRLGLPDHEIGRELYLSRHTVKHRIEKLRRRVQARNRIQLAAWAAEHGARQQSAHDGAGLAASVK